MKLISVEGKLLTPFNFLLNIINPII